MQLIEIFAQANTQFDAVFTDGSIGKRHARHDLGVIEGTHRDMTVIIADSTGFDGMGFDYDVGSQDDCLHVVNVYRGHGKSSRYIDTVAVAGAMDIDHAINLAVNQFDSMDATYGIFVANEPEKPVFGLDGLSTDEFRSLGFSADTLNKHLSHHSQNQHFLPIITQKQLLAAQSQVTTDEVMWDGFKLLSHGGDDTRLLIDLQKNDALKELVTQFDMAEALAELNITGELGFDALMDTNNRLQMMADRLFAAMSKASIDDLSVTNVTLSKPFKRNGVANVAMQFDLSDGQAIVIWFHNPDADPKKLSPGDTMVSWKWMLNKRDITAAVSPKNGENIKLAPLAMRMMRVAAKNSKRFASAQATKAKNQQALTDAQNSVTTKTDILNKIIDDIAALNSQIDKIGREQVRQQQAEAAIAIANAQANNPQIAKDDTKIGEENKQPGQNVIEEPVVEPAQVSDSQNTMGTNQTTTDTAEPSTDDAFSQDITTLSDEELKDLLNESKKQYKAFQKQANAVNDLQNEGGEGFIWGEQQDMKFANRIGEIESEIHKRDVEQRYDAKFFAEKTILINSEKLLSKATTYDLTKLGEKNGFSYRTILSMSKDNKFSKSEIDKIVYDLGLEYIQNVRDKKPAYKDKLYGVVIRFTAKSGETITVEKLKPIVEKLISGEMQLIDIVPNDRKANVQQSEPTLADTATADNAKPMPEPTLEPQSGDNTENQADNIVNELLAMGLNIWEKAGNKRIYMTVKQFNEITGYNYTLNDSKNKIFYDFKTNAVMRSYNGKAPQIEVKYTTPQDAPTPAQNNGFSYEEAHALDGDYIGTFKDERDIFKAMDSAQERLSEKGYPAWAIATANGDYVGVFALPDDEYSSGDMRESAEAAYNNMLAARENIIKHPDGNNSAVLAADENATPAESTPPIDSGNHPAVINQGTSDELRFIGENSDGTPIYKNKDGVRYRGEFGGIMFLVELNTLDENGATRLPREDKFMTKAELAAKDNTTAQDNNDHPDYTQDDIDYLNSIINGDIDPLNVDFDKLEAIGEKNETDPLLAQALAIVSEALDKASS